jgi:hypothetical protein
MFSAQASVREGDGAQCEAITQAEVRILGR